MLPGMELMSCPLAVPANVMHHVVRVESSYNPYAIGVVGGRLARQPRSLAEALATVRMLEGRGYNFSVGLAQVNRYNLAKYGLTSYEQAFRTCPNLTTGSRILAECHGRSGGDWGKSFSCYYSGNFTTGFRHGYVQKVFASMRQGMALMATTGAVRMQAMQPPAVTAEVPAWSVSPVQPALVAARIAASNSVAQSAAVPAVSQHVQPTVVREAASVLPQASAQAPVVANYGIAYPTHRPVNMTVAQAPAQPSAAGRQPESQNPARPARDEAFVF